MNTMRSMLQFYLPPTHPLVPPRTKPSDATDERTGVILVDISSIIVLNLREHEQ